MSCSLEVLFSAQRSVTLEHVKLLLSPEMRGAERKRERRKGAVEKRAFYSQKDAGCSTNVGETNFIIRPGPAFYCFQVELGLK